MNERAMIVHRSSRGNRHRTVGESVGEATKTTTTTTTTRRDRRRSRRFSSVAVLSLSLLSSGIPAAEGLITPPQRSRRRSRRIPFFPPSSSTTTSIRGWVQDDEGEWSWEEEELLVPSAEAAAAEAREEAAATLRTRATPSLPANEFRPKQSLGQNFLRDGNTVARIVRTFAKDAAETLATDASRDWERPGVRPVELGPGAGALTGPLVDLYGEDALRCVEIDGRAVELLKRERPRLRVDHEDVLRADYAAMSAAEGGPLSVVGNLPYYVTSQILFALADASHSGAVRSATVTMQYEVGLRVVAPPRTKDYGILSVVFQLYADCVLHFKIPPTVFYPKPKVDSALLGIRFVGPDALRRRFGGVEPRNLRRVLNAVYRKRRKTLRNGLKRLVMDEVCRGDKEAAKRILDGPPPPARPSDGPIKFNLPDDWASKRPEELSPGQMVELTRLVFGPREPPTSSTTTTSLGVKVWRKERHGPNEDEDDEDF